MKQITEAAQLFIIRKLSVYSLGIGVISRKIFAESLMYPRYFPYIILKQRDIQKLSGYFPQSGYYLEIKRLHPYPNYLQLHSRSLSVAYWQIAHI
jgi:hypothetical protein